MKRKYHIEKEPIAKWSFPNIGDGGFGFEVYLNNDGGKEIKIRSGHYWNFSNRIILKTTQDVGSGLQDEELVSLGSFFLNVSKKHKKAIFEEKEVLDSHSMGDLVFEVNVDPEGSRTLTVRCAHLWYFYSEMEVYTDSSNPGDGINDEQFQELGNMFIKAGSMKHKQELDS